MKKKTAAENPIIKYKWEFVRRNKDYIKSYKFHSSIVHSKQYKKLERGVYKNKITGKYSPVLEIPSSYPLNKFLDPQISYRKYKKMVNDFDSLISDYNYKFEVTRDCKQLRENYLTIMPSTIENENPNAISGKFWIDLDCPKKRIIKFFSEQLNHWIKKYFEISKDSKKRRAQLRQYNQYLKVYDLKENGKSWGTIARKVYKCDIERGDLNYAKRKVRRDYERCKKIIEGNYRQIR